MYRDVLIPTDGSDRTRRAVELGLDVANQFQARVHALYVVETSPIPEDAEEAKMAAREAGEEAGRRATNDVVDRAEELGVEAVREIRTGRPHEEIVQYTETSDVDLVVMGTRGDTGATRLGSTADRVVRTADVPVVTARMGDPEVDPRRRNQAVDDVVVATDGSDPAETAAQRGIEIAERYGADVHAVYVVDTGAFAGEDVPRSVLGPLRDAGQRGTEEIAETAEAHEVPASTRVLEGSPHEELREYAEGVDADLLTVGRRGTAAPRPPLLGGTTERIVRQATLPVLTAG